MLELSKRRAYGEPGGVGRFEFGNDELERVRLDKLIRKKDDPYETKHPDVGNGIG